MSLQEGAEYSVELSFRVNNLVSGLKYLQVVRRMGTNGTWLVLEICAARSRARAWPVSDSGRSLLSTIAHVQWINLRV